MSLNTVVPKIAGMPLQGKRCHVDPQHRLLGLGLGHHLLDLLSLPQRVPSYSSLLVLHRLIRLIVGCTSEDFMEICPC